MVNYDNKYEINYTGDGFQRFLGRNLRKVRRHKLQ